MKHPVFSLLVLILCSWSTALKAEVVEIEHFREISSYVEPDTLVVLDIDDTLLIPEQMLGCDEWFLRRLKANKERYQDSSQVLEKTLAEFESIRHLCTMRLVEEETSSVVHQLQQSDADVMCLTTQGLGLATRTVHQLNAHGIDPTRAAPHPEDHFLTVKGHGVLYRRGILFTSGTHKGEALFKLCDKIGYQPKRILFINDKKTHLEEIAHTAQAKGIPFIGLRYGFSDRHKKAFRPEIAEVQFRHSSFDRILSDEEASRLLNTTHASSCLERLRNPLKEPL